ncbi:DMT family transporter [Candidatus Saccharibacteria bacterium]|nr:DMT family transporter [Candidatus Saccharibacteria bacterium]
MLIPLILAAVAATMYAATNHVDNYLISKAVKNADGRALVVVSSLIAGAVMSIIYMFVCNFNFAFDWQSILVLFAASAANMVALFLYLKALERVAITIVAIMFQLIPVFMLFLSPLLLGDQNISSVQLIGGFIVTLAAIFVTYEPAKRKFNKQRLVTLILMTIVSLAYAAWFIAERYVNRDHDFNQTTLWTNITLFAVGVIIFIFAKTYRRAFFKMLKSNGALVIGLNLLNEFFNSFSTIISNLAGTMASVALVSFVTQGVQPFAVMILGLFITRFLPKAKREKVSKKETVKRIITIIICAIGLACIEFG